MNFCSFHHEGVVWQQKARLRIDSESDDGPFQPLICWQCEDAPCATACPAEAIIFVQQTGAWEVQEDICVGCGECVTACPYGAVYLDETRGVSIKCDLCQGAPECALLCPTAVISVERLI